MVLGEYVGVIVVLMCDSHHTSVFNVSYHDVMSMWDNVSWCAFEINEMYCNVLSV